MAEAVPRGNKKARGPAYPVPKSGDGSLKQYGGEGKNLTTKSDYKFSKPDAGPGRNL